MPLLASELAKKMSQAQQGKDKDGKQIGVTKEISGQAKAIINTLTTSTFSHVGTVTGTAPPVPGPVLDLAAQNGVFLPPLLPAVYIQEVTAATPGANPAFVAKEANATVTYLNGAAKINFDIGTMTGNSTAVGPPTPAPGVLVFVSGMGGKITMLVGADWAQAVTPPKGDAKYTKKMYEAIAKYLMENASALYAAGAVNGTFPAVGAPLVGGTGAGGTIS